MTKKTMVKLAVKHQSKERVEEFEIKHAERILNMPKNGGWELKDSKFVFENGNIRTK